MGRPFQGNFGHGLTDEGRGFLFHFGVLVFLGSDVVVGQHGLLEDAPARQLFVLGFLDFLLLGHPGFQLFFVSLDLLFFLFQLFLADFFDIGDAIPADFPVSGFFFRGCCRRFRLSRLDGGLFCRSHFDGPHTLLSFLGSGLVTAQFHFLAVGNFCGIDRRGQRQGSQDCDGQAPPVYLILHRVPPVQVAFIISQHH